LGQKFSGAWGKDPNDLSAIVKNKSGIDIKKKKEEEEIYMGSDRETSHHI